MKDKTVDNIRKLIYLFDKISYVPALSISIIFFIFFMGVFINPYNWIHLFSIYLIGSLIGFLIFSYDKNHISPKIDNDDFDNAILDTLCLGLIGCIFHGVGIFILVKGLLILIYNIDEVLGNNKHKKKENRINLSLKLYSSIDSISLLGGLVIILLVFYNLGISVLLHIFDQILLGNFQVLFQPFVICFILSVSVLLFDHSNEEFAIYNMDPNSSAGSKDLIKGIIGCCFFASGIFILFRGIIIISFPENKHFRSRNKSEKIEENFVIYSKPMK